MTDPRAVGVNERGHDRVPCGLLAAGDWVVLRHDAGMVVTVDPDYSQQPAPSCWPLLMTSRALYAYGYAPKAAALAVCTHDPHCGPTHPDQEEELPWGT